MERFSFFGRAKYDLTERVQAYTQVNFVATSVEQRLQPSGAVGDFSAAIPYGSQIYLPSVVQTATPSLQIGDTKPEYRAGGRARPELRGQRRLHAVAGLSRSG